MDTRYYRHVEKEELTQSGVRLQGPGKGSQECNIWGESPEMIWTPPKKEMKGRKRESWAEAREQAEAGRWEAVCYMSKYICRKSEKRTGEIEGLQLIRVSPWRASYGKSKFLLYVIYEVCLENVKTEKISWPDLQSTEITLITR